jgi:thymidylate synthase
MFSLIVIQDGEGGIGCTNRLGTEAGGTIPFSNKADLANFYRLTRNNIVIMGRKTYESIGKILPNRLNVIITSNPRLGVTDGTPGADKVCDGIPGADKVCDGNPEVNKVCDGNPEVNKVCDGNPEVNKVCDGNPEVNKVCDGNYQRASLLLFTSVEVCVKELLNSSCYSDKERFVIGGAQIYKQFLELNLVDKLYISTARGVYNCDIKMPYIDYFKFEKIDKARYKGHVLDENIQYQEYEYVNFHECKFLYLLDDILSIDGERIDRTLIGIRSIFGRFLEFDLTNNQFPLGTTKKMNLKKVFEELMWFVRGDTNTKTLSAKHIKIWEPNSSREFLDSRGLTYKEGDIGPTYGFAFRHYGAEYNGCDSDYAGLGYDQIYNVIDLIKNDPTSRRIMINLWNPTVLDKVALPPCLFCYQFYVTVTPRGKQLSCLMNQRSSDISLAGFWNIATGALLTYLIARVTGCTPKELKWCIGDTHIYINQFSAVEEQLKRKPRMFPRLIFKEDAPSMENGKDITEFEYRDLLLTGYNPHGVIKNILNP